MWHPGRLPTGGGVSFSKMGVVSPEARQAALRAMVEDFLAIIHTVGTVTNRGRTYSRVVGGAAATLLTVGLSKLPTW